MSIVEFNVSGERFRISKQSLLLFSETKLSNAMYWNGDEIDRDPFLFNYVIMSYYRNGGQIFVPFNYSIDLIKAELDFFLIPYDEENVMYQNIGQAWTERTMNTLQKNIRDVFTALFQSNWFLEESKKSLEIHWNIPLETFSPTGAGRQISLQKLFQLETHRHLATTLLNDEFGIFARFKPYPHVGSVQIHWPLKQFSINHENNMWTCLMRPVLEEIK